MTFSATIQNWHLILFWEGSSHLWASILFIISPLICRSGHKRHKWIKKEPSILSFYHPLIYEYLFYQSFVRWSVGEARIDINVCCTIILCLIIKAPYFFISFFFVSSLNIWSHFVCLFNYNHSFSFFYHFLFSTLCFQLFFL